MKKIVVLGVGAIGGAHLETLLRFVAWFVARGYQIGFCARDEAVRRGDLRGKPQGNNLHVQVRDQIDSELLATLAVYSSFEEVLADPDVYAVIVCSKTGDHVWMTTALNAAGKHVLCEKPIGLNVSDVQAMLRDSNRNAHICVGHILSFFPQYASLAEAVIGETYGKTVSAEFVRLVKNSNPNNQAKNKLDFGNSFIDLAGHDTSVCFSMFDLPIHYSPVMRGLNSIAQGEHLAQVKMKLHYLFGDVTIHGGAIPGEDPGFQHSFRVVTEQGELVMSEDRTKGKACFFPKDGGTMVPLPEPLWIEGIPEDVVPFRAEHLHFIDIIEGRLNAPGPLGSSMALEILQFLTKSTDWVTVGSSDWKPRSFAF